MARTILFLIHGMGQRAPASSSDRARDAAATWWKEPVDTLLALAKEHAKKADFGINPKADGVKIVPLSYCDLLVDQLDRWEGVGDTDVAGAVKGRFPGLATSYLDELSEISSADAPFFWSKAVDVLLYRAFHDVAIRVHVRNQISRALADNSLGGRLPACAFVAHSLGTAVLHDALAEFFMDPVEFGGLVNMDVLAYASLANVSKVLQSVANPHQSPVRPFGAPGVGRARARRFINVRHRYDPIPYLGMFKPSWDPLTSNYEPRELTRITQINTHSIVGYLRDPRVWGPVFEAVLDLPLSPARLQELVDAHDREPLPPCAAAIDDLKTAVDDIAILSGELSPQSVWQVVGAVTKGVRALDEARAACAAESGGGI